MALSDVLGLPALYRLMQDAVISPAYVSVFIEGHIRAKPGDRLLDIGCGPGDLLRDLPAVDYVGFDMDEHYIAAARRRYGHRARFFCARVHPDALAAVDDGLRFDVAVAKGVLHHLTDAEVADLFEIARAVLKPGARLVSIDGCFDRSQSPLARRILEADRGEYVRDRDGYLRLAGQAFRDVRAVTRHDLLRIPYTHLIMECTT